MNNTQNLNEPKEVIDYIFNKMNKRYKIYSYILIGLFIVLLFSYTFIAHWKGRGSLPIKYYLLNISGIVFVIMTFFVASNLKNKKLFRILLFDFIKFYKPIKTFQDQLLSLFTILISLLFYVLICLSPSFIFYNNKPLFLSLPEIAGIQLIVIILAMTVCYGVIILPRIISERTQRDDNIYIYWFYFYLHKLSSSPFLLYLLTPMFLLSSLCICLFPFATKGNENISLQNLFAVDTFSLLVTILGIWLTITIVIINDVMKDYNRLYRCYEDYTTYQLQTKFNSNNNIKQIIIGFGNLSKILCGFIFPFLYIKNKKELLRPLRYFEIIIDKDYNLRILPRGIIVVEKDKEIFEELRTNNNNGFTYGFFNGLDILSINGEENKIPKEIALLGVCGNGANISLLKDIGFDNAELVINTSSDLDMGMKLKKIIDVNQFVNEKKPTLISTVEDNTSYSFLEADNLTSIFPLHTGRTEGAAIGNRLFMYYNNLLYNNFNEKHIVLIGTGYSIYYTIETFRRILKVFEDEGTVKNIIQNSLTVFTNENSIVSESYIKNNNLIWDLVFTDGERYEIKLVNLDPLKFSNLIKTYNKIANTFNNNTGEIVFVITTIKILDTLRITDLIKQLASLYNKVNIQILVSSAYEINKEIKKIIEKLPSFNKKRIGYPQDISDIVIKKNSIIGSQIISMTGCTSSLSFHSDKDERMNNFSGELSICCNDQPLSYISALLLISKLIDKDITFKTNQIIPSFYYSYSYPLKRIDKKFKNTFVFRADTYLTSNENYVPKNPIDSYYINSGKSSKDEINDVLNSILLPNSLKDCGHYTQRCSICTNNTLSKVGSNITHIKNIDRINDLATIKIWAEEDSIPGSLAICIADFLMIGNQLSLKLKQYSKILNIIYENCSLCNLENKIIARLYAIVEELDKELIDKIENLIKTRNIRAIKIKTANKIENSKWDDYCKTLLKYLNKNCNLGNTRSFGIRQLNNSCIVIVRNDISNDNSLTSFIDIDL